VIALCVLLFVFAAKVDRALGTTGNLLLSRLLGVLLAALAVQYVIDGLRAVLAG
jgi:multiple antibiotic resistance protein